MFTGLIRDVGRVRALVKGDAGWRVEVFCGLDLSGVTIGASVACSGCCLSVVEKGGDWLGFDVSKESLAKTVIKDWAVGDLVNIEPSLRLGDEMGGHIVSGHVDGLAELVGIEAEGDSWRLRLRVADGLAGFIASKGSVALDGVSLTVNAVEGREFGANIIPHTWGHTNLHARMVGDLVNIEIDMLARYVARMLEYKEGAEL